MPYSRICVAAALQRYLDITPIALRQRDLASTLAQADGAQLSIITVEAPVSLLPGTETTREKLNRFAEPLVEAGMKIDAALLQGRPSREIRRHVVEAGCDVLIIGSHSKRGPLDVGLGSTASALAHDLPATVIMIRPMQNEAVRTRELMIPRYPIVFPYG